jgi:hypothetical protein
MTQLLPTVPNLDYLPLTAVDDADALVAELNSLLLRRVKLTNDIARIRRFLKRRTARDADARRLGAKAHKEPASTKPSVSHEARRQVAKCAVRRSLADVWRKRPERWELERACRIALVESAGDPVSVETLYDRIERRGSITFGGYKRPFRAIVVAMKVLVKRGEASLSQDGRHRRWRWGTEGAPPNHQTVFTHDQKSPAAGTIPNHC